MIWINGIVSNSDCVLSVYDKINLGMTAFTTLLVVSDVDIRPIYFVEHYNRLLRHASVIGLRCTYTAFQIRNAVTDLAERMGKGIWAVRIQITAGLGGRGLIYPDDPTVFITISPSSDPYTQIDIRVMINRTYPVYSHDRLVRIKSNYALRALAKREAIQSGFDDCILLNEHGHITSASTANIVLSLQGQLYTPSINDGVMDGVIRGVLLESGQIQEKSLTESDFVGSDAAWLINSLGIRSIIGIDNINKTRTEVKALTCLPEL